MARCSRLARKAVEQHADIEQCVACLQELMENEDFSQQIIEMFVERGYRALIGEIRSGVNPGTE